MRGVGTYLSTSFSASLRVSGAEPPFSSYYYMTLQLFYREWREPNQQNAQINSWINLLLFDHSNMFRPLNRSHHQGV
jgi:hypothetical protein